MPVSLQHDLFKFIHQEHKKIEALIESCTQEDLSENSLKDLLLFAVKQHHFNEEELLFKTVGQDPRLVSGGPLCMFFMDDYILHHPVDNLTKLTGLKINIPKRLSNFYETGSNLRIPINEHLVGDTILTELIENYDQHSENQRQDLFKMYRQIQHNNKSKEETCFLHLCSNLLSEQQADEILEKWKNSKV